MPAWRCAWRTWGERLAVPQCLALLVRRSKTDQIHRSNSGVGATDIAGSIRPRPTIRFGRMVVFIVPSAVIGLMPSAIAGAAGIAKTSTPNSSSRLSTAPHSPVAALLGPLAKSLGLLPGAAALPTTASPGYWMAGSAGGVNAYGGTAFKGSMNRSILNGTIVGMAATPSGQGYWLVASDGGVFSFGDAPFFGAVSGKSLNSPIVGMAATPSGQGYWLVASDGGVFSFGDAPFRGSASGRVPEDESIRSVVSGPGTSGGSAMSGDFETPVVAAGPPYNHGATGYDVSYPQCHKALPTRSNIAVVGVNRGSAFTINPCFSREASWAGTDLTVYINLNSPQGSNSSDWTHGPAGTCATGALSCDAYNYGFNTAQRSTDYVRSAGYSPSTWLLDVETSNYWSSDTRVNDQVIAGALAALHLSGGGVVIYSTNYQWSQIAGSYVPGEPAWYATGVLDQSPRIWCTSTSFAGGPVDLVQGSAGPYDGDYEC
jgi:hypothetical protein